MHRSGSTSRFSDEYYHPSMSQSSSSAVAVASGKGSSPVGVNQRSAIDLGGKLLPTYDPQSDTGKKEAARARLSENLVHLIPLILLLCAMVLWFFSYPEIGVMSKDDSILARIKNMSINGYSNWNGSSMTIGQEDLDPIDGIGMEDTGRDRSNRDPQ